MSNTDIIIHDEKDNVGVVVIEKITPDQDCNCWIMENDKSVSIQSKDEIPLGHKIAMIDLNEGDTILKYGHDIGKVVKNIKKGEQFSKENITSKRTSSGISIENWNDVIGKEAEQDFSKDSIIKIPNGGFYED